MVRIENVREDVYDPVTGIHTCVLDLQTSKVSELKEKYSFIGGVRIAPGSISQLIETGDYVTLNDDGSWYDDAGNVVS